MDSEEIEQAAASLAVLLAAIEAGELVATPGQVGAILGALEVLKALRKPNV